MASTIVARLPFSCVDSPLLNFHKSGLAMRLLHLNNHGELCWAKQFYENEPAYAILSHTWEADSVEVNFKDLMEGTSKSKPGYRKIQFCAAQAARDGLKYFWVDTCCIDRSNSTELTEAINFMFRWYRTAAQCYVYLSDISTHGNGKDHIDAQLRKSLWFTRTWTAQDLIAPPVVKFFSQEGELLGDKKLFEQQLHEITGIAIKALQGSPLSQFSVAERMSWAEKRMCKREEDRAYSLLGIFGVTMPLIYGEGRENAIRRLREAIGNKRRFEKLVNNQPAYIKYQKGLLGPSQISTPSVKRFKRRPHISAPDSGYAQPAEELSTNGSLYSHPLAVSEFRILILESGLIGSTIVGHICEVSLLDPPEYYALSYVWGQEPAIHPAVINDKTHLIRPNLYHALQRIRPPMGQLNIWVDSICINQLDDSERNAQVRQMATIYSKARSVFVWLGEEDSSSKVGLKFADQVVLTDLMWTKLWWEQYGLIALAQILDRPWFRRGWVLQEAAFSATSIIYCGDHQINMCHFSMALSMVRVGLSTTPFALSHTASMFSTAILTNYHESPAVRLLDTIKGSFTKSADGKILNRRMSLETVVDLSKFSETSDPRDTVYALLNLANDITTSSQPNQSDAIVPDYGKSVLDVFMDFVLHCCSRSRSLDVICRPWAPTSSSIADPRSKNNPFGNYIQELPSWIASRDNLPFGDPSRRLNYRLHGKPLVGGSLKRIYNAHYGSGPQVSVRRNKDGACNGSLDVMGLVLGEIAQRSTRLANAILTKECLQLLGTIAFKPHLTLMSLSDTIWRTVCADRDGKGEPAPRAYRLAMLNLLQISSEIPETGDSTNLLDHISSIDIEELLDTDIPLYAREFLVVVRDVIWNRRTFRSKTNNPTSSPLVGLIPQNAKVGDQICILYGCSVPVVLRRRLGSNKEVYWQLIGDAYVHGIMDGEAIRDTLPETLISTQTVFEIR
ncbi:hypothetical protein CJF31_00007327 [Rutstroemia sp. NJR-2017a BVV2]|nr:hypothetical protein CJF31_00007327 [Rutstroemia sp. NJR-2017a BVV2]